MIHPSQFACTDLPLVALFCEGGGGRGRGGRWNEREREEDGGEGKEGDRDRDNLQHDVITVRREPLLCKCMSYLTCYISILALIYPVPS